ncbi:MAG: hypothetical protein AAFY02_05050 [Pseudomonadota bacterium]
MAAGDAAPGLEPDETRADSLPNCYLTLIAPPALVALVGLALFHQIAQQEALVPGATLAARTAPTFAFSGALYTWIGIAFLGTAIYLIVIALAVTKVTRRVSWPLGVKLAVAIGCLLFLLSPLFVAGLPLGSMRTALVFGSVDLSAALATLISGDSWVYEVFLGFATGLVVVAAVFITCGIVATLAPRPVAAKGDEAAWLNRQHKDLMAYLYLGATIFVIGQVATTTWLGMAGTLLTGNQGSADLIAAAYRSYASGISTYFGAVYVAILAAAYLPAALIQSRRMAALPAAASETPSSKQPAWAETVKSLIALLSPLLAGPLSALVSGLMQG